jgi:hypothetical protein
VDGMKSESSETSGARFTAAPMSSASNLGHLAPPPILIEPPAVLDELQPTARAMEGDRFIAYLLRTGAVMGGALFAASLLMELLPSSYGASVAIDSLRKAAGSVLLATPVVRLIAVGVLLGAKGEWRYTAFAGCVLALLGVAIGSGLAG